MKKVKPNPILLLILALILAAFTFGLFRIFINQTTSSYAIEIAAAFVGTLLTIIITAILLNHQTNSELKKEKNVKIYETKVDAYKSLMEKIEEILLIDELDNKTTIQLQIIFQKIAFVAGIKVLESLKTFAKSFAEYSKDGKITKEERKKILSAFGELSVEIREDLVDSQEDDKKRIQDIIKENIESMTLKTTEDAFLGKCDDQERVYFGHIIQYIQSQKVAYEMGKGGISVRDQDNKAILYLFPTGTRRSIQIRNKELEAEKVSILKELLKNYQIEAFSFKPSQVPVEAFIEMLDVMVN